MPSLDNTTRPTQSGKRVESYKTCVHYAVLKYGTDSEGNRLSKKRTKEVLSHFYGLVSKQGPIPASRTLADPKKKLTQEVDLHVRKHESFFRSAARKAIEKCEVTEGLRPPPAADTT